MKMQPRVRCLLMIHLLLSAAVAGQGEFSVKEEITSNVFKAGHRIRLLVSSSNFPRFNRNLNTGEPLLGAAGEVLSIGV